jgi:hypothetical protein
MTRIRSKEARGADGGAGGSEGSDPPAHRFIPGAAIPAVAGIALLAPVANARISPELAWFLALLNIAVIVGAIVLFAAARTRTRSSASRAAAGTTSTAPNRRTPGRSRRGSPTPSPVPTTEPRLAASPPVSAPRSERPDTRTAALARSEGVTDRVHAEFLTLLGDPDPFVRVSAVAAMRGRMECEAILIGTLNDRYPMVRREAVRALRTTGSPAATETLIKVAAHDPSAEVREEAVAALGALLREGKPGTAAR